MSDEQLADLTQRQRDRLAFVELRLRFIGEIRRQDLVSHFGIQTAAATRDIGIYKYLAPGNLATTPRTRCMATRRIHARLWSSDRASFAVSVTGLR